MSRQCSGTEPRQPDDHQPPQSPVRMSQYTGSTTQDTGSTSQVYLRNQDTVRKSELTVGGGGLEIVVVVLGDRGLLLGVWPLERLKEMGGGGE